MKKIYLFLVFLFTMLGHAQAQQAYYVHLKGGDIQVFYTDIVDSMTVVLPENGAADTKTYQKIWTPDSVFQYDLAEIDSISYVTPATQYKPGVIKLEDGLLEFVTACDSLILTLSADTPQRKLPKVGDKLVCLEMTDILPYGFAGEVTKVETQATGTIVICQLVSLNDIFECYYGVQSQTSQPITKGHSLITPKDMMNFGHGFFKPGPQEFPLEIVSKDGGGNNFAWEYGCSASLIIEPSFEIRTTLIVEGQDIQFNLLSTGNHYVRSELGLTGSFECDFRPFSPSISIPLGQPFVCGFAECGPFLKAEMNASFKAGGELNYGTAIYKSWSTNNKPSNVKPAAQPLFLKGKKFYAEGCIDGNLQVGAYLQLGFTVGDKRLAKAYAEVELGEEIVGNATMSADDLINSETTTLAYEKLLASSIEGHYYVGWGLGAEAGIPGIVHADWNHPMASTTFGDPIFKFSLAPKFKDVKAQFSKEDPSALEVHATVEGQSIPVDVGFVVHDSDKEEVAKAYVVKDYSGESNKTIHHTFLNMFSQKQYKVSPFVSYYNHDAKARPEVEVNAQPVAETGNAFNIGETSADIQVNFRNIPDEYLDGGVLYEGKNGLQKASLLVTSDGEKSVHLSGLKGNTVYSYKAYIQWNGQYVYGETKQFTTKKKEEEDLTGLWIDLGLPSGVKWASHNVGASSPEGYGAYFAWGETSPKSSYAEKNSLTYLKNMSDISGKPQYDAAAANWGGGARMPTLDECVELGQRCTSVWTTRHGVNGRLVTGPNGNTIFLPAAGYWYDMSLRYDGEGSRYWSSTPDNGETHGVKYAFGLDFESGHFSLGWDLRLGGHPVRPVRN